MSIELLPALRPVRVAWNKGRIIGQKGPLLPRPVWSINVRFEMANKARDLALFNMAVDSKLRGCDLTAMFQAAALDCLQFGAPPSSQDGFTVTKVCLPSAPMEQFCMIAERRVCHIRPSRRSQGRGFGLKKI